MKQIQKLIALAVILLVCSASFTLKAGHVQGAELTYVCLSPNVYEVKLKLFRDCSGAPMPAVAYLNVHSPVCGSPRTVTMNPVPGAGFIGDYYCPQVQVGCPSVNHPNFEMATYSATVAFSAADQACPDWILSWEECCRTRVANTVNSTTSLMYTEAYLNLGAGINNTSPKFGDRVIPFVNKNMPVTLGAYAIDPEGDSLVYSLKAPLGSLNTPLQYGFYFPETYYNADSSKQAVVPGGTFSETFPLQSYDIDWSQPGPVTAVPSFILDRNTGSLSFTPFYYVPNSLAAQGKNKYVVVVQVDEYRRINGVAVKVGSIRREKVIVIVDCGPNMNPRVSGPVVNGTPLKPDSIIDLKPGMPLFLNFSTADSNATDVLALSSNVAEVLPGATFTKTVSGKPSGTISWTPTASHARSQIYYFHVSVEDNACPVKGVHTQTFGVRVQAPASVAGLEKELDRNINFTAFPNPFSAKISFKINCKKPEAGQEIRIYNALGRQIHRISLPESFSGTREITWEKSAGLAKGLYMARLFSAGQPVRTLKFSKL